ncbi:MAG: helix-turn-helix domain-containing protein [Firmicutes bacterium]|nr:helix-turn-helix domain-containing protein [Bacillota bacterium]
MKLGKELERRKKEIFQFYYRGIGDSIRKKRIECNLTQELLARGICSNTYISKIENNAIAVNKESLLLIMERMNISFQETSFPEKMIENMEKSIQYFYRDDKEAYKTLYDECEKYEFGILIQIIRLGYHTLIGNTDEAEMINNELIRYLNSLEDYGFTVYSLYACWLYVSKEDYETARSLYEAVSQHFYMNDEIFGIYQFLKFQIYGNLHLFNVSRSAYENAKNMYMEKGVMSKLFEMRAMLNLFYVYENQRDKIYHHDFLSNSLCLNQRNKYFVLLSIEEENPLIYLDKIQKEGQYYLDSLYLKCLFYKKQSNVNKYNSIKEEINQNYCLMDSEIDYYKLLSFEEKNEEFLYKEYLINQVMPYVTKLQNIYLMNLVNEKIVTILSSNKRYKDALANQQKTNKAIKRLKTLKKSKQEY